MRPRQICALLAASVILAACGGSNDPSRVPAEIVIVAGNHQSSEVGLPLPLPVTFQVNDRSGDPLNGITLTFTVTSGAGVVSPSSIVTDAQGHAIVNWTLGYEIGAGHVLTAQVASVSAGASASATLGAGATLAVASGNSQTGAVGQALGFPLGVRVRTASNHDVGKVPIDWTVATGGGSVAQSSSLTDSSGIAKIVWTLGALGGGQTATAGNVALTPVSVTLSATAVVPTPATISGTIILVDSQLSALRGSSVRGGRATSEAARIKVARRTAGFDAVPGELLVTFKPGAIGVPAGIRAAATVASARAVGQAIRARLGAHAIPGKLAITGVSPVIRAARLKLADPTKTDSVARVLAADPSVLAVGRNGRWRADGGPIRPGTIPNDSSYPNQSWHYSMIDLPRAWSITTGSSNVIVAVLDNGIVFHHPAFGAPTATYLTGGGNLRNDGYDFVTSELTPLCASQGGGNVNNSGDGDGYDPDPSIPDDRDPTDGTCLGARDDIGAHGTHVAGTIGAVGNDGISVTGVDWHVSLRPVRVLGLSFGDFYDIAQGILYAAGLPADNGAGGTLTPLGQPARIINLSLGGNCPIGPDPVHDAIQAVTNTGLPNGGVLVVAAAGNDGSSTLSCPAAYDEVLSVGAVGPSGHRSSFSNFGSTVDIAAPGGEFPPAPGTDGTYGIFSSVCDFTVFPAPCTPLLARYFGTSMAAPHVAGVAALLLAQDPSLTAAQLRTRLVTYATPMDPSEQLGAGIVNARNALTQTIAPSRQLYVRAVNATTGAVVATVAASGGNYTLGPLPDGSYYVVAGEDEGGDGFLGVPGRRFGAFGGASSPTALAVTSTAGQYAAFAVGFPVEREPNDLPASANRLMVDGAVEGSLTAADPIDLFRIVIPTAGTYTFETTGFAGDFCSYALDLNTTLDLLDQNQVAVAPQSTDIDATHNNFCSRISTPLAPGTYLLRVSRGDFFGSGPHSGRYILGARTGP